MTRRREGIEGRVTVVFKTRATDREIEDTLRQLGLKYTQISPDDENPELRRMYVLETPIGVEGAVIRDIKGTYSSIVKYAEQPGMRKII